MKSVGSGIRGARGTKLAALLGTASVAALSSGVAHAQVAEVIITGSLIAGETAVGVPITAVGEAEFLEQGSITVADMLFSVPSVEVDPTLTSLRGGGTTGYGQDVAIHGFHGSGGDAITLLLVDGGRWPIQGHGGDTVDPSIIPQLAVDRVDILTAGASAVYGSDAIVGVINVVLKRNFEGAISQVNFSAPVHNSQGWRYSASHLHGISWDTGNVTLTGEVYYQERVTAASIGRDKYTTNFSDLIGYDATPLALQMPGVLSIGEPEAPPDTPDGFDPAVGTRYCANCYLLPHGIGGPYDPDNVGPVQLSSLTPFVVGQRNEQNQRINYDDGWALPTNQRDAFVGTLDQELTDDFFGLGPVTLAGTMFYSHRYGQMHFGINTNSGNSREHASFRQADSGTKITGNNPYIPQNFVVPGDGRTLQQIADDGELRFHFNATPFLGSASRISFQNMATRYKFGFNFDALPFGWVGDMFYSMSNEQNRTDSTAMINRDRARRTIGEKRSGAIKPDSVPFFNPFCDALVYGTSCQAQTTLDYLGARRLQENQWRIRQMQVNASGPVVEIPTGEIQAALGFEHTSQHFRFSDTSNHGTAPPDDNPASETDISTRVAHAFFGQLNIPVLGGEVAVPGIIEGLDVELGYRIDKYDFQDKYIKTPKVAATLFLGGGITGRFAWGKSFRAPGFSQSSAAAGSRTFGVNQAGGAGSNDHIFDCTNQGTGQAGGSALAGSATAILNPNCLTGLANESIWAPAGLEINGGSGLADYMRGLSQELRPGGPGKGLSPESARQFVYGINIAPLDGIFQGLNLDVSYFDIKISDTIRADASGESSDVFRPDNPISRHLYAIRPGAAAWAAAGYDPGSPFADPNSAQSLAIDGEFNSVVAGWAALPASTSTFERNLTYDFLFDGGNANVGFIKLTGIDWSFRYDWDMADWGSFHIGNTGYYELDQKEQANDSSPVVSPYGYTDLNGTQVGQNSGARLKRVRSRAGWTNGTWSTTLFATTQFHDGPNTNIQLPHCFWDTGFSAGDCYPGSPYYPQAFPEGGFYNTSPGWTQFDINVTYNTGMIPANEYLQNINISLTVNNFLDADPPFTFNSRSRQREIRAYDDRFSELGRFVSLTLTKTW